MKKIKKQLLKQITKRLVAEFNPEKIMLFGSYAWGNPHANSDLDLLIVVNSSDLPPTRRAAKAYRCLQGIKIPIEIIVSTNKELERYRFVPSSLTKKIIEKGIKIYG
jgi:predicted nucleotidyltransferase